MMTFVVWNSGSCLSPKLFYDLQDMVGELGIKDLSLQKIYANLFHQKISKRQRLSNWEAPTLSDKQKQYLAIDAWRRIRLYDEILRLKKTQDYDLVVVPEPEIAHKEKDETAGDKVKTNKVESKEQSSVNKKARTPRRKVRRNRTNVMDSATQNKTEENV